MPSKNSIKTYTEGGSYHIYNRGIDKRRIFEESKDYEMFLHYLKIYLSPVDLLRQENPLLKQNLIKTNLSEQMDLLAYCLMSNHFHLLVKQKTKDAITKLTRQLTTAYSMYFNKKYGRTGPLFGGRFKAAIIDDQEKLMYLSRYIHQNPREKGVSPIDFPWSSLGNYIEKNTNSWLKPQTILEYFSTYNNGLTYKKFIDDTNSSGPDIEDLILE